MPLGWCWDTTVNTIEYIYIEFDKMVTTVEYFYIFKTVFFSPKSPAHEISLLMSL